MNNAILPLGLYIHIPWCLKKCPYCDFNSHELKSDNHEQRYVQSLIADLRQDLEFFQEQRPIRHIFIGGGTPSLFSPKALATLLEEINKLTPLSPDIEITLEANPGTFESEKFAGFKAAGINRLSIGIQSFDDACLQRLGRIHNAAEATQAVSMAQQVGFANINLDLMFGLPDAEPGTSTRDVTTAIGLHPQHISLYQLTLEPNTYFHKYPPKLPELDAIVSEQTSCQELLAQHNYRQYEISAYAQPGLACRHNCNYWRFGDYLGIGAGAHGKISLSLPDKIIRYYKPKNPADYMHIIESGAQTDRDQTIAITDLPLEFVMNHLRLRQGFDLTHFESYTGLPVTALQPGLNQCLEQGMIEFNNNRYACSAKGWDFLDSLLQNFLVQ